MGNKNLSGTIRNIMDNLDRAFCSEADFQHVLAWKLHEEFPNAEIFLEYPMVQDKKNIYHDIAIKMNDEIHFIELKYKTKKTDIQICGETITLKNQSAHNLACVYFWQDVERLENTPKNSTNYCIFLTNDKLYYDGNGDDGKAKETKYYNFRIAEGKTSVQEAEYDKHIVKLKNSYTCNWKQLNNLQGTTPEWKYLLLEVQS